MRLLRTLATVILIGCGEPRQNTEAHAPGDAIAPAFKASIDDVQKAVVRAVAQEFGPITLDDRTHHRIESTRDWKALAAELTMRPDGMVEVQLAVSAASHSLALKRLGDVSAGISREMSR